MFTLRRVALAFLLWQGGSAWGEPLVLQPAEAAYRVLVSGIPIGMEATVRLQAEEVPSEWHLSFVVDHRLIKHRETSRFHWKGCQPQPAHYEYASAGFGIRRGGKVAFDWEEDVALTGDNRFDLPPGTIDALTLTQAARCLMRDGVPEMHFDVMEPGGLEEKPYRVHGMEEIETPAGTFDALKVERIYPEGGRRTFLWAAPSLDWFLVRMDHEENALLRGRMELTRFNLLVDSEPRGAR